MVLGRFLSVKVDNGDGCDFCIVFQVKICWGYNEVSEYFVGN